MEIERKFLVSEMPDVSGIAAIPYERYYTRIEEGFSERIQRKGEWYEIETKRKISNLEHDKNKRSISKEEFESLRPQAVGAGIVRDSYNISDNPRISIKVYHGQFEGLVRAEVEFDSVTAAQAFTPLPWMGREITGTPLGLDAELVRLTDAQFRLLIAQ